MEFMISFWFKKKILNLLLPEPNPTVAVCLKMVLGEFYFKSLTWCYLFIIVNLTAEWICVLYRPRWRKMGPSFTWYCWYGGSCNSLQCPKCVPLRDSTAAVWYFLPSSMIILCDWIVKKQVLQCKSSSLKWFSVWVSPENINQTWQKPDRTLLISPSFTNMYTMIPVLNNSKQKY